jgi:hypothetical protein
MVGCNFLWYMLITGCLVQVGAWLMHLFMVQVDYKLRYKLMQGSSLLVHSTSTLGRLDKASPSGCSHLLVVAAKHRGLYPPSGCSQRIGELELPSGCSLRNKWVGASFQLQMENKGSWCF